MTSPTIRTRRMASYETEGNLSNVTFVPLRPSPAFRYSRDMTSTQKPAAVKALLAICEAVVELVKASGSLGKPGGELYAFLMTFGATLEQFEMIMDALVKAGRLTKRGDLYFAKDAK